HLSPGAGVWLADFVFFVGGVFLLWQSERRPIELAGFRAWYKAARFKTPRFGSAGPETAVDQSSRPGLPALPENGEASRPGFTGGANQGANHVVNHSLPGRRRLFNLRFPTILDEYVLRDFALYFAMIVAAFVMLLLVFTLFELLGDVLRNQVSPITVGEYLLNVTPYFLYYPIAPLSMLLAVLVTFGLL